jgi:hypothetical protein
MQRGPSRTVPPGLVAPRGTGGTGVIAGVGSTPGAVRMRAVLNSQTRWPLASPISGAPLQAGVGVVVGPAGRVAVTVAVLCGITAAWQSPFWHGMVAPPQFSLIRTGPPLNSWKSSSRAQFNVV